MIDSRIWCVRNIAHDQNNELPRERRLNKTAAALCFSDIPRLRQILPRIGTDVGVRLIAVDVLRID